MRLESTTTRWIPLDSPLERVVGEHSGRLTFLEEVKATVEKTHRRESTVQLLPRQTAGRQWAKAGKTRIRNGVIRRAVRAIMSG